MSSYQRNRPIGARHSPRSGRSSIPDQSANQTAGHLVSRTAGRAVDRRERQVERGTITIESIVIVPLVMIAMFAIIQYSVGWYAKTALIAAAQDGLRAGQTNQRVDPAAVAKASASANAGFVSNLVAETSTPMPGSMTVTVTAQVPGAFPGLIWTLTAKASGPTETFRGQGQP